jgi:hypothetical protein
MIGKALAPTGRMLDHDPARTDTSHHRRNAEIAHHRDTSGLSTPDRRHDIDWLRVIAIGLLLIYHVAIGFQPWGIIFGFITNVESWQSLWWPMTLVNIWRIPFLFLVSGMGVYFSMQHRRWNTLIQERSLRILLPYVFGMMCIFPVSILIRQHYYHRTLTIRLARDTCGFSGISLPTSSCYRRCSSTCETINTGSSLRA